MNDMIGVVDQSHTDALVLLDLSSAFDTVDFKGFCRAMLASSAAFAVMRVCVSVSLSVTFVRCAKTNKHIIRIFSPSGSHAILVFPCQTV